MNHHQSRLNIHSTASGGACPDTNLFSHLVIKNQSSCFFTILPPQGVCWDRCLYGTYTQFILFFFLIAIPYSVQITTAADPNAGTNANAFIRLTGQQTSTERINLELQSANSYEPGKTHTFSIEGVDVGKIEKLEIGHDGLSKESGWLVENVEVDVPTRGQNYYFVCGKWLAKDHEDGKTVRELRPLDAQLYAARVPYEVTVVTGDQQDAGTDAGIYMIVYGLDGSTQEVALEKQTARFERGRTDKMKVGCIIQLKSVS